MEASPQVTIKSAQGRWILTASILGSGLAGIDATVVNVALPAIGQDLDSPFSGLQWTVTAYTLTLASFILLCGSLADLFGRRRIFIIGVVWFATASLLCGLAPSINTLIAARALQGVGAALLTPGSLAMIQASFVPEDRSRAIGTWSGLSGVAMAIGPFLGGWLVETVSWRWIFLINAPLAVIVVAIAWRQVPETRDPAAARRIDVPGAALGVLALGGITYALVEQPERGLGSWPVTTAALLGVLALMGFIVVERTTRHPMLPLTMFSNRQFSAANLVTFTVYGGLGAVFFLLVLQLQIVAEFRPIAAGVAILPITMIMLVLSARSGQLAYRIGPRLQMSVGPVICAVGLWLMLRIGPGASYVVDVLPGVGVFGFGLAVMVAPLTATALSAAPDKHAGLASGVNNAVARAAGLMAIAVLPQVAGISGSDYAVPAEFDAGFERAMIAAIVLLLFGAAVAAVAISNDALEEEPEGHPTTHCGVGGPPAQINCPDEVVS